MGVALHHQYQLYVVSISIMMSLALCHQHYVIKSHSIAMFLQENNSHSFSLRSMSDPISGSWQLYQCQAWDSFACLFYFWRQGLVFIGGVQVFVVFVFFYFCGRFFFDFCLFLFVCLLRQAYSVSSSFPGTPYVNQSGYKNLPASAS